MRKVFLLALVAAVLLLSACSHQTAATTTQPAPVQTASPSANRAPNFGVYTEKGERVQLSDFLGKPVVLNFWASWCGPCRMEMPDFDETCSKLGDKVQFMMVNLTDGTNETVASAASFIAQQGYSFPVFFDIRYEAASAYSIRSIPTTIFIDAQGNIVDYAVGAISGERLQQGIDKILN